MDVPELLNLGVQMSYRNKTLYKLLDGSNDCIVNEEMVDKDGMCEVHNLYTGMCIEEALKYFTSEVN